MGESPRRDEPEFLIYGCPSVGAVLVLVLWFLGSFLLAPVHCGGSRCETMRAFLNLSVISALVGIGCLFLFAFRSRIPRILLLGAATGAFASAAVDSVKAGLVLMPLVDVMLMLVPVGILGANELTRSTTEPQNKRRAYLIWALVSLTVVIAFAVVTSLLFGSGWL
jgi:hypothetical protein